MADIELVIKISEEIYKDIMIHNREMREGAKSAYYFEGLIQHGIPLPKGHGRLGDLDALEKEIEDYSKCAFAMTPEFLVKHVPIILGADKEHEEKVRTYGDIYEEFCDKFPNADVEDYRPADPMYVSQLRKGIPSAIVVWLRDKSKVIYVAEKRNK